MAVPIPFPFRKQQVDFSFYLSRVNPSYEKASEVPRVFFTFRDHPSVYFTGSIV
jgi:hypothetical protein